MIKFTCPRRIEDGRADTDSPFVGSGPNLDSWAKRDSYDCCNYCGSLRPEVVLEAIESGREIGSTDKNYKIYVDLPGSDKLKRTTSQNYKPPKGTGYKKVPLKNEWYKLEPQAIFHGKFYFQHFSVEQKKQFVELYNNKSIKFQGNIGFYNFPYFMAPVKD